MSFLPEDYTAPKSSSFYMKLVEGENRIRILSKPIMGWEDWYEKKPVRFGMNEKPAKSFDPKKPVRHFWAFIVFNYIENEIQIMQVTQATIRKSLESLCKDADWGAPFGYDIKIMKSGEGVDTEYAVNPVPHKPVAQEIIEAFNDRRCNLNALFANADPFAKDWPEYTPMATDEPQARGLSLEQMADLKEMFDNCAPEYQKQLLDSLAKMPIPVKKIEDVPVALFDRIKTAVRAKRDEFRAMTNEDIFAVA